MIQGTPVDYDFNSADFKIITYLDSTGCTSCNMRLDDWDEVIDEFKSFSDVDVNFLMVVASRDEREIANILKSHDFRSPVIVDPDNRFDSRYRLPANRLYRTFLLDGDNKVVAVGNPVMNPKIRSLYREIILSLYGESTDLDGGPGLKDYLSRNLGVVPRGDSVKVDFLLTNNDSIPLTVQAIVPSCDCTEVALETDTILPGSTAIATVRFTGDTIPGSFRKQADIFYHEKENPERLTVYGIIN